MKVDQLEKKALQELAEQQHNTVRSLTEQLKEANNKITQLENLIAAEGKNEILVGDIYISTEEIICLKQLQLLRKRSDYDELTYEETKKVEVYSKILSALRQKGDAPDKKIKEVTSEDLLLLINDDNKQ